MRHLTAQTLLEFEAQLREQRGWKRKDLCAQLGISQAKWRRHVESPPDTVVDDRLLGLGLSALWAQLSPWPESAFTKLEHIDMSDASRAPRVNHIVHFTTFVPAA